MKETLLKLNSIFCQFLAAVGILILCDAGNVAAQKTISGIVTDAENGETLPAASIHIENTYRGTITNENGAYILSIPDTSLPATVEVRFMGYESQRRTISDSSESTQDFRLTPSVYEMEAITR